MELARHFPAPQILTPWGSPHLPLRPLKEKAGLTRMKCVGEGQLGTGCTGRFPRKPRLGGETQRAPEKAPTLAPNAACSLCLQPAPRPSSGVQFYHMSKQNSGGASGALVSESCLISAYLCFLPSSEATWTLLLLASLHLSLRWTHISFILLTSRPTLAGVPGIIELLALSAQGAFLSSL